MSSDRRYTRTYALLANDIQQEAEMKLGRPLTRHEANSVRNAGSLMMLEAVAMSVNQAVSPDEVVVKLRDFSAAFADRLAESLNDLSTCLQSRLNRSLDTSEQKRIAGLSNCLEVMVVLDNFAETQDLSNAFDDLSEY